MVTVACLRYSANPTLAPEGYRNADSRQPWHAHTPPKNQPRAPGVESPLAQSDRGAGGEASGNLRRDAAGVGGGRATADYCAAPHGAREVAPPARRILPAAA